MRESSSSSIRLVGRYGCAAAMAVALALGGTASAPLLLPQFHLASAAVSETAHEKLASYGVWRHSTRFGDVWVPGVSQGWRPYTDGHWMWTDAGWYWQSNEPFGWIVYHYGRWVMDDSLGWVWVSGDDWAPAWVVWRQGADDVGWAPAPPPEVEVVADNWWSFVPVVAIGAVSILPVVRPVVDNVTIIRNTTIINENTAIDNHPVPTTRIGNTAVPINAGPALGRLPPNVEHSITAARIAPPAKGKVAEARLDASKGDALKAQAVETSKSASEASKPGGAAAATSARPNADGAVKAPGAAAKPTAEKEPTAPETKPQAAKPEPKPTAPAPKQTAVKPEPKPQTPAGKPAEKPEKPQAANHPASAAAKAPMPANRPGATRQARPSTAAKTAHAATPTRKVAAAKRPAAQQVRHANAAPAGHPAGKAPVKKHPQEQG